MRKIPTLFARDHDTHFVTDQVTPGCEWVLVGEGTPTRKRDGTCVMFDGDRWWARREVKPGKTAPPGWVFVQRDETTGKEVGWEPIEQSGFVKHWREAQMKDYEASVYPIRKPGTYELCGPKVNGNPEKLERHTLFRHGGEHMDVGTSRDLAVPEVLARWMRAEGIEGIVWWRDIDDPDCEKAKLKAKDFPA